MKLRSAFLATALAAMAIVFSCNAKTQAVPHQGKISWASYTAPAGTTATFTLFRGIVSGGPYGVTVKAGIAGDQTSFTDTPLNANAFYCWNLKVVIATAAPGSGYAVGDTSSFASQDTCGTTSKDPVPTASGLASVVQ